MLAELAYQPPPLPESTHELSGTWHGRSNSMAPPTTTPRALGPFNHYNTSALSNFTSITQERATPTPGALTQSKPIAAAAHYSAGGTSRNSLVYAFSVEVAATAEASVQANHALATAETTVTAMVTRSVFSASCLASDKAQG
ncbi:hypothetical protein MRX96_029374 [Rhipicephalus microplus]